MSASERRYLIGIGKPLLDIRNKYLTRAFSSEGVRYCWRFAFSGRPCTRYHSVVGGTLLEFDRAAYALGSVGSGPIAVSLIRRRQEKMDRKLQRNHYMERSGSFCANQDSQSLLFGGSNRGGDFV